MAGCALRQQVESTIGKSTSFSGGAGERFSSFGRVGSSEWRDSLCRFARVPQAVGSRAFRQVDSGAIEWVGTASLLRTRALLRRARDEHGDVSGARAGRMGREGPGGDECGRWD